MKERERVRKKERNWVLSFFLSDINIRQFLAKNNLRLFSRSQDEKSWLGINYIKLLSYRKHWFKIIFLSSTKKRKKTYKNLNNKERGKKKGQEKEEVVLLFLYCYLPYSPKKHLPAFKKKLTPPMILFFRRGLENFHIWLSKIWFCLFSSFAKGRRRKLTSMLGHRLVTPGNTIAFTFFFHYKSSFFLLLATQCNNLFFFINIIIYIKPKIKLYF